ncbi:MAG: LptA/OstA family protein, partial [Pseudomonadota bacterium]|nr:LptA/OstA family protein [Pseudomonadota bacterium]
MSNPESHFIMPKPSKNAQNVWVKRSVFKHLRRKTVLCIACSVSLAPYQAWSNETHENSSALSNNLCAPALIAPQQVIPEKVKDVKAAPQNIEADSLLQPSKTQYLLQGNAVFKQPGLVVLSDEAVYDKNNQTAVFNGNVEVHQSELTITADNAHIDNANETAVLNNTKYQMLPSRTHGKSKNIQLDQKAQQAALARASLTTCKVNSDQSVDW